MIVKPVWSSDFSEINFLTTIYYYIYYWYEGWQICNTCINVNSWNYTLNSDTLTHDVVLVVETNVFGGKRLPVPHRTGREILYTVFGINLSRCTPLYPVQPKQILPHWEDRILRQSPYTSQSGYFILTQCRLSLPHSICLSLWLSSVFSLPRAFILPFLLSLFLPLGSLRKGHLAKRYAQGMFTSLNDWWGVMKQSNLE